jgi:hypothetical protein
VIGRIGGGWAGVRMGELDRHGVDRYTAPGGTDRQTYAYGLALKRPRHCPPRPQLDDIKEGTYDIL